MSLARALVFGLALASSSAGCVSALALKSAAGAVLDAQRDIIDGTDALDQFCQHDQVDAKGLATCRASRDKIRAALRRQVDAVLTLGK